MTTVPLSQCENTPATLASTTVLDAMGRIDRLVLHNALLAQVDDNHAGGTMCWDDTHHAHATALFNRLEHDPTSIGLTPAETTAALLSLMYVVHETDHSDLDDDTWAAAEAMLNHLASEFGR